MVLQPNSPTSPKNQSLLLCSLGKIASTQYFARQSHIDANWVKVDGTVPESLLPLKYTVIKWEKLESTGKCSVNGTVPVNLLFSRLIVNKLCRFANLIKGPIKITFTFVYSDLGVSKTRDIQFSKGIVPPNLLNCNNSRQSLGCPLNPLGIWHSKRLCCTANDWRSVGVTRDLDIVQLKKLWNKSSCCSYTSLKNIGRKRTHTGQGVTSKWQGSEGVFKSMVNSFQSHGVTIWKKIFLREPRLLRSKCLKSGKMPSFPLRSKTFKFGK